MGVRFIHLNLGMIVHMGRTLCLLCFHELLID